jgi:phosphatidate cytidylyltransferase
MTTQTPEQIDKANRRASEIRARLVMAPLVLGLLGGVLWIQESTGSAVATHVILALLAAVGGAELAVLFRAAGLGGHPRQAALGCGLLCAVGVLASLGWPSMAAALAARIAILALFLLWVMLEHLTDTRREAAVTMACRFVPLLYVGLLLSSMTFFAQLEHGALWVAWIVLTAKASDMAGWAIGLPFGKHKMIPSVSPGKSWEGTLAGVVASALVAILLPGPLGLEAGGWSLGARALFGALLGAASILAGVTWSGWKRRLDAKDASALVPGLGGVMDMIDSILLAGPTALLFYGAYHILM